MYPPAEDPAALRGVAQQLRGAASEVCALSCEFRDAASSVAYEGPASVRFREAIAASHRIIVGEAGRLEQFSGRLDHLAAEADDAWRRYRESLWQA